MAGTDFNGDGVDGVLLREQTTGAVLVWNDPSLADWQPNIPGNWEIHATNIDGGEDDELLLREPGTGDILLWLSDSATAAAWDAAVVPGNWDIVVGDFDGDGVDGVLLREQTTGAVAVWNDPSLADWQATIPG